MRVLISVTSYLLPPLPYSSSRNLSRVYTSVRVSVRVTCHILRTQSIPARRSDPLIRVPSGCVSQSRLREDEPRTLISLAKMMIEYSTLSYVGCFYSLEMR